MLDIKRVLAAKPKAHEEVVLENLTTPWGEAVDAAQVLPGHPNPQFARASWHSLNGWWECAFVKGSQGTQPTPSRLAQAVAQAQPPAQGTHWRRILVPFSPEAPLSGVNRQLKPDELLWYRCAFGATALGRDERALLHFEAVDHTCQVRVNGWVAGMHAGGYGAFSLDISDYLQEGSNTLEVCVADGSEVSGGLRGKQRIDRGDIWYTAQSGIWQPVWIETVPAAHIEDISVAAHADGRVALQAHLRDAGSSHRPSLLQLELFDADGARAAQAAVQPTADTLVVELDVANPRPWSPEDPHLYRMVLTYGADVVESYCGLRDVAVRPDAQGTPRLHVNGRPVFLKAVLDQGYWPDGLMTAPSEEALAFDLQAARQAGFNAVRKHLKVENARWYHLCDRMGMLVMQDMVNGGDAAPRSWQWSYKPTLFKASWNRYADDTAAHMAALGAADAEYQREWWDGCRAEIRQLGNHPCIVAWVLFNEGWGQFKSVEAGQTVAELDSTRPIDVVSGWYDQGAGDFKSVHNYFRPLEVWPDKPRGKDGRPPRAFLISECGGLTFHVEGHSSLSGAYGYAAYDDAGAWARDVRGMLAKLDGLEARGLAGYVYTQLTDIEEETNGLVSYDRRVNKLALDAGAGGAAAGSPADPDAGAGGAAAGSPANLDAGARVQNLGTDAGAAVQVQVPGTELPVDARPEPAGRGQAGETSPGVQPSAAPAAGAVREGEGGLG